MQARRKGRITRQTGLALALLASVCLAEGGPAGRAASAELVMYTQPTCPFCRIFEREIAPIYDRTTEGRLAPLRRITLPAGGVEGGALSEPVRATPTFILVDEGRELGRITGYRGDESFWGLLGQLVTRIGSSSAAALPPPEIP